MSATPNRRGMVLLDYRPSDRGGALVGRASVVLPIGLQIDDIAIFSKNGRTWAQMPAEPMRDRDWQILTDDKGKARYRCAVKWSSRELQDAFSEKLVPLISESK